MRSFIELNRIIWAVDPFAEQMMLQRAAAWAIHELTEHRPASVIQPVYLINDYSAEGIVPRRQMGSFLEKLHAFGSDSLNQITNRIKLENLAPLKIIASPYRSVEEGTRDLLSHADRFGAQLIVASTRAGKHWSSPFALPGSFVEALIGQATRPLLIVNPRWRRSNGIPSLFFPTDLTDESHEWFLRTLDLANGLTDRLTLFHKLEFPLSQPFEVAARIFPEIRSTLFSKIRSAQADARRWEIEARKAGIRVSVVVDSRLSGALSDSLLACLERHAGSLVIAPPLSATYSKSTIRLMMRKSAFPMFFLPTLLRREARAFGTGKRAA